MIAAKLHCAPDVHAIKEAPALALPSVQGQMETLAVDMGYSAGVLMAKLLNRFSKNPINPLIGSAGVSAVPMAARVSNKVGLEADGQNFLLMHAMGPNVAGVIGSAIAAGVMLKYVLAM
ncbi:oxaloacetate decarboxylase subunit beta [Klebsiella variicola]|nr:oxaloacetate decarboxylase subunit beta [Klebsiella variicola]